ncbi:MAG TPA: isoleucine--tRNA ligase, partial [Candidatus Latescibacteria bacterium]|nr:isoleucine--tRNA ligase [Candidatus Latescibacterota bacterium]
KGILYKREEYLHRYPVCWRCESELVFRLVDEWFISMDELRYRIMDVARKVNWIPEFGLDRELDWLRNMHDWCISKKRYWGLALPIYECNCGHFEVIGGEMELEERAIEGWKSFEGHSPHRPWIDAVKIKCPECGSKVSRIPDVGNPWLDAGIVPYSTLDYRHNRSYWKEWFPAEFITECFHQQFRNWFYSLLAMSTVLEGREPFQTVLGHARVLDENGEEMHKSRGNAIWFDEAAERMGVEVMRWMFARQNPAVNLNFGYGAAEEVKRNFLTLWNSYSFFVTYANLDRFDPTKEQVDPRDRSLLDRWLLARLNLLIQTARTQMDRYNVAGVVRAVDDFIEGLSNWYIRRSRRRFWKSENDRDKAAAYLTLYETLVSLCKILAPILPFLAEELYQNLVRTQDPLAPESLHLCDYPVPDTDMIDPGLLEDMEWAIKVVNLARSARNKAGVKIRQPLSQLIIAVDDQKVISAIGRTEFLIKEEVNVKGISFVTDLSQILTLNARPNFKVLGPRLGKLAGKVAEKIKGLGSEEIALISKGSAVEVEVAGKSLRIEPEDVEIVASEKDLVSESEDHLTVALDTTLTEALLDEGFAREFIHKIQNMRKAAGFAIADRINIYYQTTDRLRKAVEVFEDHIKAETLCIGFMEGDKRGDLRESCRINGEPAEIAVERIPDHG